MSIFLCSVSIIHLLCESVYRITFWSLHSVHLCCRVLVGLKLLDAGRQPDKHDKAGTCIFTTFCCKHTMKNNIDAPA
jgi:hypothetical protein